MDSLVNAISGFFIAIAIVVLGVIGFNIWQEYNTSSNQKMVYEAYDACLRESTVSYLDENTNQTRTEPSLYIYEICIRDKGLDTLLENPDIVRD